MKHRVVRWLLLGGLASAMPVGCSDLLGIEERAYTPEAPLCDRYCAEVMEACAEGHEVYASIESCLNACPHLPEGAEGDAQGNSVQCRRQQAKLAAQTGEPGAYCRRAGPGGGGVCGTNCEGYCALLGSVCGPTWHENVEACLTECAEIPDHGDYRVPIANENSVQCRLYHVTASTLDTVHCEHAAGEALCVEPAEPPEGAPPAEPYGGGP